jgi:hypothetical protein
MPCKVSKITYFILEKIIHLKMSIANLPDLPQSNTINEALLTRNTEPIKAIISQKLRFFGNILSPTYIITTSSDNISCSEDLVYRCISPQDAIILEDPVGVTKFIDTEESYVHRYNRILEHCYGNMLSGQAWINYKQLIAARLGYMVLFVMAIFRASLKNKLSICYGYFFICLVNMRMFNVWEHNIGSSYFNKKYSEFSHNEIEIKLRQNEEKYKFKY